MNSKSIIFYFPYHEVSGVPVLFLNIAEYLADRNPSLNISIIDYEDGFMATNRKQKSKVNLIVFSDGERLEVAQGILIMQAILPYAMRPELNIGSNIKVLFWNLHPDIFFPIVFPFVFFREYAQNHLRTYKYFLRIFWNRKYSSIVKFVNESIVNNSLHFMDISNLRRTEDILNLNLDLDKYLPIASSTINSDNLTDINRGKSEMINFSWIGRLCDFKYHSVELLIEALSKLALKLEKKIQLFVIGAGPYLEYLQKLKCENTFFNIIYSGTIPKDNLDCFLLKNIDINVSMGTSALESARLHIPTIVIDYSYKSIQQDYNFRWLHETKDYDLGHLVMSNDIISGNKSLETMFSNYMENTELYGELSYNYFKENHSVEVISEKLLMLIDSGIGAFGNYNINYFRKGCVRRVYEYIKYKL